MIPSASLRKAKSRARQARAKRLPAIAVANDAALVEAPEDDALLLEEEEELVLNQLAEPELEAEPEAEPEQEPAIVTPLDHAARLRRTLIVVATSDGERRKAANDHEDPALSADLEFVSDTSDEPPFDPPEDMEEALAAETLDEEPPFDPPELEEGFILAMPVEEEESELAPDAPNTRVGHLRAHPPADAALPVPPISIFASWDRVESGELLTKMAQDARLNRAEIVVQRGGFDGALVRLQAHTPDLLIVDSTLRAGNMLACVDRIAGAIARGVKVIVLGNVNDVSLFRELAQRGVSEYVLTPAQPEELASAICRLYADADKSRVIAVIGARGGIGASTVAHNIAWSIAERQGVATTLVDLDLPFGAAALSFRVQAPRSLGDALEADDSASRAVLEEVVAKRTERLQVLTAPACVQRELGFDGSALEKVIAGARRMSSFVVLDLPHQWSGWVKQALMQADEIVVVASPDLASLRNADNMLKHLRDARRESAPVVVLSMVGVPKRPEIPLKEFAEALDTLPAMSLAFEPALFGEASISGQMLGELDPRSKAALSVDELASALTGRAPFEAPRPAPRDAPLELAQVLVEAESVPPASSRQTDDCRLEGGVTSEDSSLTPESDDPFAEAFADFGDLHDAETPEDASVEGLSHVQEEPYAEAADDSSARELAPIIIVPAPALDDYIERARKSAHAEAFRLEDDDEFVPPPPQPSFGWHRLFALGATTFAVILMGGAWYLQSSVSSAPIAEPQPAAAATALTPAAAPSNDPGQLYLAAVDLLDSDPFAAAHAMEQLAQAGYPLAQYHIGQLYEHGEGVAANIITARQWTERAANAGNVRAMHDLGVYFAMGDAAPAADPAGAFRWFQQAAEFGLADSQYNLGILYEQGRGVEEDAGEALFWLSLAAAQGDESAAERATTLEAQLNPMEVEQARMRVANFEPRVPDPRANAEPEAAPAAEPAPAPTQAARVVEPAPQPAPAPARRRSTRAYTVNVTPVDDSTPR